MNEILLYILKSTVCMSILYGVFHILLRKEKFFKLNRRLLIAILIFSAVIPLTYMPEIYTPDISIEIEEPVSIVTIPNTTNIETAAHVETQLAKYTQNIEPIVRTHIIKEDKTYSISSITIVGTLYLFGLMLSLILSIVGISRTISLIRKPKKVKKDGYSLLLLDKEIPAFSFGKNIVISKTDYQSNKQEILTHEEAHVRHMHSLDLLLLEVVKIVYWFNPLVYIMTRNLKEIHEYQADEYTINNGIDAINYQKLIIKKCVGHEQFALANSFHHCQIKKRIAMINKKQTGKAWKWKAAAFIPVACLLLMSFSNTLEKKDEFTTIADKSEKHKTATVDDKVRKQWTEADFIDIKTINEKEITDKNLLTIRLDLDWGVTIFKYNKGVYTGTTECKYKYNDDLLVDNTDYNDKELKSVIDYKNVTTHTKRFFKEADINGKKEMVSLYKILIAKESRVSDKEYKELLNFIGNTITKIRNNHSIERYGEKFAELDKEKKDIIEQLVPLRVYYKEKKFSLPVSGKRANFVRAKDSKILSLNIKNLVFLINRYDFLWADETMLSPMSNNRTRYIKKYFDYTTATEKTKSLFKSVNINNKQVMVPTSKLYVYQEPPMNKENRMAKVKDFINLTKMIFNKIKDNYSKQIFSKSYNQLSANNKQEIDSILPDKIIANDKPISLAKAKVIRKKDIIYIIEK